MISVENYKQLVILEQENYYIVKFVNDNNKVKTLRILNNESGIKKIIDLVQLYLKLYGVNGFKGMIPVCSGGKIMNKLPEVILANGDRKITVKTTFAFFRNFTRMVVDNYRINREFLLKDNNIKEVRIDALSSSSGFSYMGNIVNLTLEADPNMNIYSYERKFFSDLLEYKCPFEKIDMELIKEKEVNKRMCVATCGELKLIFPLGYTYSTLVSIINEHNNKIDEIGKRR